MASKVFLDANILLDLTLKREGYDLAKQIMKEAIQGRLTLHTSSSIVHIIGYWLTKGYGSIKAKELVLTLLDDVQVLETNHETMIDALQSKFNDIEDAIQYYTAIRHKLDVFISRDSQLQKLGKSSLPIISPEEYLKTI